MSLTRCFCFLNSEKPHINQSFTLLSLYIHWVTWSKSVQRNRTRLLCRPFWLIKRFTTASKGAIKRHYLTWYHIRCSSWLSVRIENWGWFSSWVRRRSDSPSHLRLSRISRRKRPRHYTLTWPPGKFNAFGGKGSNTSSKGNGVVSPTDMSRSVSMPRRLNGNSRRIRPRLGKL